MPIEGATMATRRTTMRSRTGTKLYAVRDETGQFKDIQTYKRAHSADLRHKSKAEKIAAQGPIERKVRGAAQDAVDTVRKSVRGAVAAVERVAKRAVKQVANRKAAPKTLVTAAPGKTTRTAAAKKTTRTPAAKKTARRAAKKR
jgi:hypothetical protein